MMFQFETTSKTRSQHVAAPTEARSTPSHFRRRVFLAWAEHCIECAAPACYQSCDLYRPTAALKCRRFDQGIVPNRALATSSGPAAEISFRRWGKLEAQGNGRLIDDRVLRHVERGLRVVSPVLNRTGILLAKATKKQKWATPMEAVYKRVNNWLQGRQEDGTFPDTFIIEVYNPANAPVSLVLSLTVDRGRMKKAVSAHQLPPPLTIPLTAEPGLTAHELPALKARDIFASGLPFNIALAPAGAETPSLVFRRLELVSAPEKPGGKAEAAAAASKLPAAKCVVFDLDHTLWEGVLLEGEVRLRPQITALFKTLDERGILISVASKNARDDALKQLESLGLLEYLVHPQIGWMPKSQAVKEVARAIDIGVDTLMFVDDNPFERAEVAEAVPGVTVLSELEIDTLLDHPRLQGAVTPESRSRRKMYQEAIAREQAASSYGDDYLEFLRSCEIDLTIRPDEPEDFERVVELVQRTNQLNFSGRKYSRGEISSILAETSKGRHVIICSDRFGSYGTVGFCLSHREGSTVVVDDLMLSCRVQGKFIEQAIFWYLTQLGSAPATSVVVNFKRTDRNRAAEMVLEKLGFVADGESRLQKSVDPETLRVDFMAVNGASGSQP